jgi:hypothetical protein
MRTTKIDDAARSQQRGQGLAHFVIDALPNLVRKRR